MKASRLKLLLLTLAYGHRVSYYDDWVDALHAHNRFSVTVENIAKIDLSGFRKSVEEYDAIIMLHSCNGDTLDFFRPLVPALAERRRARLLSFVGNEFNSPYVSMEQRNSLMRAARVDIIATQLLEEAGKYIYRETGARVISVPHALNPSAFAPVVGERKMHADVGVRGYIYPPWIGDDDRNIFVDYFQNNGARFGLSTDIAFDQRLSRDKWAQFLKSVGGTVSTEVGSWYISPNDDLIDEVVEYMKTQQRGLVIHNDTNLRRFVRRLPMGVKALLWKVIKLGAVRFEVTEHNAFPFEDLKKLFFDRAARAPIYGKAISSRHFDAIGTNTCQIMLRGRYNDILEADQHYIAVDADYSNIDEAVRRFKDIGERQAITRRAYELVINSHTYAQRSAYVQSELMR